MTRIYGAKNFTVIERTAIESMIADYMMFGLRDYEIIDRIEKRTTKLLSQQALYQMKNNVRKRMKTSEEWLDRFVNEGMIGFYRQRILELEYIQKKMLLAFESEAEKDTGKQNKYLMAQLNKVINENSRTLSEYGLAPPMLAKIKQLLPIDITELNKRYDAHMKSIGQKFIDPEDEEYKSIGIISNPETAPKAFQSPLSWQQSQDIFTGELERIQLQRQESTTPDSGAIELPASDEADRGISEEDRKHRESQRKF